jgi:hypothetical protein
MYHFCPELWVMINNHKGQWKKGSSKCLCCNKTMAELKRDFKRFSELRRDLDHDSKTRTMILHGFKDYIGTDSHGSHYWYTWHGDPCRGCGGAPQTVGELFLAVYSEGQWYCNKCYEKDPRDPSGNWIYIPADDEETLLNYQKKLS